MNPVPVLGLKAPDVTAGAGASPTSAGPGDAPQTISQGLQGRNDSPITPAVPPLQGGDVLCAEVFLGLHPRLSHHGPSALPKLRAVLPSYGSLAVPVPLMPSVRLAIQMLNGAGSRSRASRRDMVNGVDW